MKNRMFDYPVFVKSNGNSHIEEIACLEDGLEFLYDWPKERRGVIYETALRACRRAFDSGYPLSAARQAFCGFAKSARIHEAVANAAKQQPGQQRVHDDLRRVGRVAHQVYSQFALVGASPQIGEGDDAAMPAE